MNFRITRLAIAAMTVLCAGMCAAGPKLTAFVMQRPSPMINGPVRFWMILIAGYALALLAFLCLFGLYRLIRRIEQGDIFTAANVKSLRAILLLGITCAILMSAVAVMAAFMVLIIRVVQHSFERAVAMKDELDLTI